MTHSHELAKLLLSLPNLPIATHANNHTYSSGADSQTHGRLRVALLSHYAGAHILIGNPDDEDLNKPNWFITQWLDESVSVAPTLSNAEMDQTLERFRQRFEEFETMYRHASVALQVIANQMALNVFLTPGASLTQEFVEQFPTVPRVAK